MTTEPVPVFPSDRLDLWLIRSPVGGTDALDLSDLDAFERARARAFVRPGDGPLYAAAHVGLRRLLGRYTGRPPAELRFAFDPRPDHGKSHGRPVLAEVPLPLHFSLSHSSGVALVGVAARPLGVDVQKLPRAETVEVCARALHPAERTELAAASPYDRSLLFGRLWTRKEAYLKGLGTGLRRAPAQDYLGLRASAYPADWTVLSIDAPCLPTHAVAVAVRRPAPGEAGLRRVPGHWLDATDAWSREDTPEPVRVAFLSEP